MLTDNIKTILKADILKATRSDFDKYLTIIDDKIYFNLNIQTTIEDINSKYNKLLNKDIKL